MDSPIAIDFPSAGWPARLGRRLEHRPRGVVAVVSIAMLGAAAAAFGIAPLAPDAAELPRRVISQSVTMEPVSSQLEALAAHELQLYRSDTTRRTDTADSLLQRLGVTDPEAARFVRSDPIARLIVEGRPGKVIRASVDPLGRLGEMVARFPVLTEQPGETRFTRLTVSRQGSTFETRVENAPLVPQLRIGSGTISTSLFAAMDEARLPEAVATQLAEIFGTDVDFSRDLRRGDRFSVVYEAMTADGEPLATPSGALAIGRVVAASFHNAGREHEAVWFSSDGQRGGYYDFDGRSKRRSFLPSPMEFSRVTSGFSMRMHPILKTWRQHLGIDYAAPTGTTVRAVGDAVVDFAGWRGGYGNVVILRHGNDRETTYAHLSRILVRPGAHVEQGDTIGAVGSTGWATGPHLHFEFKVKGEHRNPLEMAKASDAVVLDASDRVRFAAVAASVRAQLEAADPAPRQLASE